MEATNALLGYDMVWAVTQDTLKSQLWWLFNNEIISSKVSFGDLTNDGLSFEGTIDVPEIDLIGGPNGTQASFAITFLTGTITYYKGFGPKAKQDTYNMDGKGMKLAFDVNLNIAQLGQNYAEQGKVVPPTIESQLTKFQSSDFTIQHIFLDFQDANLSTYNESRSNVPIDDSHAFLKQMFGDMLGAWIIENHGKENPYILGYVACKNFNDQSVFQPTGSTFLIQKHTPAGTDDGLSALCFLLNTQGKKVDEPQARFTYNLVESPDFSGTALVSKDTFETQWLQPYILNALSASLGVYGGAAWQANKDGSGWTYDYAPDTLYKTYENADSGIVNIYAEYSQKTYCTARLNTSEPDEENVKRPAILVDGYFYRKAYLYENLIGISKSVEFWQENKLPFTVKIFFVAGDNGTIQLRSSVKKGQMESHSDESFLARFADVFNDAYSNTLKNVDQDYQRLQNFNFDNLQNTISSALQALQNRVILPAPSVYLYKDLTFNDDGDLKLHISYNTPTS